jgi:hypothetical protein
VTSLGYNLIGDIGDSTGWTSTDLTGSDASPLVPLLGPLQDNGGPTQTLALLPDSPALNAGDPSATDLAEFDQRGPGFARVIGNCVDIGAFEYQTVIVASPAAINPVGSTPLNATIGMTYGTLLQVQVTDSHGNPVAGRLVTFSAPTKGASGSFNTSATVVTDAQGIATAPAFTANHIAGRFTVTASVAGTNLSTSLQLTNTLVPARLKARAGSGQKATAGGTFAKPPQVTVTTATGAPDAGITVTFELPGNFTGAFAGPAYAVTDAHGVATSPALGAGTAAGTFTVLAWVAGVATPVAFTLTTTAGAAAAIIPLASGDGSAKVGTVFATTLRVQVTDQYSNPVAGSVVTFIVSSDPNSGAGGTFPGKKARVTATTNGSGLATAPALTANGYPGSFLLTATPTATLNGITVLLLFNLTVTKT